MSRWGDEFDEELQKKEEIKVGFMFSFKSMSHTVERLSEETREWDNKHPKIELMKMWANVMLVFAVLLSFSYSLFIAATGIFYFFYGYVLLQIYSTWKQFKYSRLQFWTMTVTVLIILVALAYFVQRSIFGS